jgi:hypothetical protein
MVGTAEKEGTDTRNEHAHRPDQRQQKNQHIVTYGGRREQLQQHPLELHTDDNERNEYDDKQAAAIQRTRKDRLVHIFISIIDLPGALLLRLTRRQALQAQSTES